MKYVVIGAGGFIGGHLVKKLLLRGEVTALDIKPPDEWWQTHENAKNRASFDAASAPFAVASMAEMMRGADAVFNLAADMGGMGFISGNKLACMKSVRTTLNALDAAAYASVPRFFYSSSACVYPMNLQDVTTGVAMRESDAYPADPEDGYGWEKLFGERLVSHFREETAMDARSARYHNVYGPFGTWTGGREKAPAALCRKVAEAKLRGETSISVWGDGAQTRTFMYVTDCVDATVDVIHRHDYGGPINIGSEVLISVDELARIIMQIADVDLEIKHVPGPQGVRGRASDNTEFVRRYGYDPSVTPLREGLTATYLWVAERVQEEYDAT